MTKQDFTEKWKATGMLQGLDPEAAEKCAIAMDLVVQECMSSDPYEPLVHLLIPIARRLADKSIYPNAKLLVNDFRTWWQANKLGDELLDLEEEKVHVDNYVTFFENNWKTLMEVLQVE